LHQKNRNQYHHTEVFSAFSSPVGESAMGTNPMFIDLYVGLNELAFIHV
jgi:hypothetical protein